MQNLFIRVKGIPTHALASGKRVRDEIVHDFKG